MVINFQELLTCQYGFVVQEDLKEILLLSNPLSSVTNLIEVGSAGPSKEEKGTLHYSGSKGREVFCVV